LVIETSLTHLQTLTAGVCTGTAVRSVTTLDSNTEITLEVTIANRILAGSYVRVKVPLEQFLQTGSTIQYKENNSGTAKDITVVSTDSNHVTLEYVEFCNGGGTICSDGSTMSITLTQGFKNPRTIKSTYSQYFVYQTYTSDKTYIIDESTASIVATDTLTAVSVTSLAISFESSTVAHEGYIDVFAVLGSSILASEYINLSFNAEFILDSGTTPTCQKVDGSTTSSLTWTTTTTSGYISTIKVEGLCAWDSTTTYTIRVNNVRNILEAKAFSGEMTYETRVSTTELIGSGTLTLSSISTLTPGTLTSTSVARTDANQGAVSEFTITFTTPGVLLDSSTVQLDLPLNQIVKTNSGTDFVWTNASSGATLTRTATPTATSTYNYLTLAEWMCSGSNCASGTTFSVKITESSNPAVAAITYDSFVITLTSPSSNNIFTSSSPLNALPDLIVGVLNNHVVTHQNDINTFANTEYLISFTTTSAIPANGKVVFVFPDERIYRRTDGGTLTVQTGSSYTTSITAFTPTYDSTNTWLTQIELTGEWASGCAIGSFQYKISGGIKNPPYVKTLTGNFVAMTTDSSGALVNRDIKPNSEVTEITPTTMTATITRSTDALSATVELTCAFTNVNTYPTDGKIVLQMPTDQITLGTGDPTWFKSDGSTALTCSFSTSGSYYVVTINQWCTTDGSDCPATTSSTFIIKNVVNPSLLSANVATTSWVLATATTDSYLIDGKFTNF
jgi:hypothetical protein